jgi:nucleobase:cation symporter-1, NCS1 family
VSWLPRGIAPDLATPPPSAYVGPDLAPIPASQRTWGLWHFAALWVGLSVCIPTYMLAAALIQAGLSWQWALTAILIGNAVVLVPMLVNAHAGTRYGIPFPVYVRASFGLRGAHVPALMRGLVACGWFGIQTWIGGLAIHEIVSLLWPGWTSFGGDWRFMAYGFPEYSAFLLFWVMNVYFIWAGTESIKWLETASAPLLIAAGLALLWWAKSKVGGFGAMLAGANSLGGSGNFSLELFVAWVTAMVGFWATLALSIPDFTRLARTQRDQAIGQTLGLLTTMPLFAFIGVAVTGATVRLYGEAIWNPVTLVARLSRDSGSVALGLVSLFVVLIATLTTNIAANIVAPATAVANLRPSRLSIRAGGLIAALLGIVLMPWKLLDTYQGWLLTYSGLLGAVGGVIVCDYLVVRRGVLRVADLYTPTGIYWERGGVNVRAMVALVAGAAAAMIGAVVPSLHFLFSGAWFSAAAVAFITHWLLNVKLSALGSRPSPQVP